jgi:hypothetical protein
VIRGDAALAASGNGAQGIEFQDYYTKDLTTNADIQGMGLGMDLPFLTEGTQTVEAHVGQLVGHVPSGWACNVVTL